MRRGVLVVLGLAAWGLAPAPLSADVVFTRDGKVYRGTASRMGAEVVVQIGSSTIRLPAADVIHITKTATGATPPPMPATSRPAPGQPGGTSAAPATPASPRTPAAPAGSLKHLNVSPPPISIPPRVFAMDRCDEPEAPLFMLMRGRGVVSADPLDDTPRQIEAWQCLVHERRRKLNNKWIKPEDFVRHRLQFLKNLEAVRDTQQKAREAERKLRSSRTSGSYLPRTGIKDDRLPGVVIAKLQQAANSWADPVLRSFLGAMVNYRAERYTQAATMFRACCEAQPRVAGYWQGYALCMDRLKEYEQALAAAVWVVRLRPDERDSVQLLHEIMGSVSGPIALTDLYTEAQALMDQYGKGIAKTNSSSYRSYSRTSQSWVMPGRSMRGLRDSLPTPPYDRLRFRQAVGVPISKTSLLVDAAAVTDALDLYVRVSPTLLVPAKARRVTSFGSRGKTAAVPLTLATVEGYSFTPIEFDPKKVNPVKDMNVTAYSLGLYEEMGHAVLEVLGKVSVPAAGSLAVTAHLLPGDAAGPVLNHAGQLVGFLQGKADPRALGGGPDVLFSTAQMADMLERSTRSSRSYGSAYSSRSRREAAPLPVPGRTFVVYATFAETFQDKSK